MSDVVFVWYPAGIWWANQGIYPEQEGYKLKIWILTFDVPPSESYYINISAELQSSRWLFIYWTGLLYQATDLEDEK